MRLKWITSASVPVCRPAASVEHSIPSASAASSSRSLSGRLTTAPRVITGPLPSPCSPISPGSTPGASVACVTSTTTARSGSSPYAITRAPCAPISSCTAATPATGPPPPPASFTRRATSIATYTPRRLSSARETSRSFGSSTGSAASSTWSPGETIERASSPSFAPMSTCRSFSRIAFLRSSASVRCGGLRPTTPGRIPSRVNTCTRWPTSTCGSQPPDCTTCRKPLSLTWLTSRAISSICPTIASSGCSALPFTRATVVPSRSTETSSAKAPSGLAPHARGLALVPGRAGGREQLKQKIREPPCAERLAPLDGGLDRHRAVEAVRDEAVLVRGVHELVHALLARVARHGDPRPQRDLGDPQRARSSSGITPVASST